MNAITLEQVSWEREDRTILKDINWQVEKSQHWCILGLNGSGKTTLLNIINGYQWPTSGKITVLGKRFGSYDLRELRKQIGWVSSSMQTSLYESDSALEIVLSGRESTFGIYDIPTEEEIEHAKALLHQFGCKSLINRPYRVLSQGEKQKVLIARALISKPDLLILDEPCTGLDLLAREELLNTVQKLADSNGPTIIYVTHHIEEVLPYLTHTLLLKDGKIFAQGRTVDLLNSETLTEFYGQNVVIDKENERYWLSFHKTKH